MPPGVHPAAVAVAIAALLVTTLLPVPAPGQLAPPAPVVGQGAHDRATVYDPLRGNAALGIPRYEVRSGFMTPDRAMLAAPDPAWLAFDPIDRTFWVAVPEASPPAVQVIPAVGWHGNSVNVPVGVKPFGVAVDNASDTIAVTNTGSNNLTIISGATERVIASVSVGIRPTGIVFDGVSGEFFVANNGSATVTVVSATSWQVVDTIPVGLVPMGLAFDARSDEVFVANQGSFSVSVIRASTHEVVATVPVGVAPYGVAWDNATDTVYVTNSVSNNISVISGSTNSVLTTIGVAPLGYGFSMTGLAFDSAADQIWVGAGRDTLVVVNASSNEVGAYYNTDPSGVAYDPEDREMCVTETWNSSFGCFTSALEANLTVPIALTEVGLPSGTPWQATLCAISCPAGPGVTVRSTSTTVVFRMNGQLEPWNGPFPFTITVGPVVGYVPNVSSFRIGGPGFPATLPITFAPGSAGSEVLFEETGLSPGGGWWVSLNNTVYSSSSSTVAMVLPNGSFPYAVGSLPGFFASAGHAGTISISGAQVVVEIQFSGVPGFSPLPPMNPSAAEPLSALGPVGWLLAAGGISVVLLVGVVLLRRRRRRVR